MNRSAASLFSALMAAVISASTHAQQPARGNTAVAGTRLGTSVIAGAVSLGDVAKTAVRRAVVTLTNADGDQKLAAISDDDGRFMIERVPAGRYTLEAQKPAHLTIAYGARRPSRRGTTLIVGNGQRIDDLTLLLPRGAVLAGRLTLSDGQPASNIQMMAVPSWLETAGGTPGTGAREFRTNDLGEFRLFGLTPDTYAVVALPSFGQGDVESYPDSAISSILRQLQQPGSAHGARVGSPATVAYAPTYFPGTPSIGDALRITVAAGQVREGLDFTARAYPAATIFGRVVSIDGAPTQAVALSIEPIGPPLPMTSTAVARVGRPNRNGEFEIAGVSPGLYRLRARADGVRLNTTGVASTGPDAQTQYAVAEVSVSGANISGVLLQLQEGLHFTGTVSTDGSAPPPAWKGASVTVQPITVGPPNPLAGVLTPGVPSREGPLDDAGRFTVTGLEPFAYEIRITLPPVVMSAGWQIESVRYSGRELRDTPLTFADSLEGVEIRLTTKATELTGQLTTESGAPATDYFIVAFPADRALWHAASPRVRVLRPAMDGTFSTRDLPSGTYRLAVLADVEDHEPRQKEFLESIYIASIEVSLAAGRTTRQDLRMGR